MIDLTFKSLKYYEIKWESGEVLELKPPTQQEYILFNKLIESNKSGTDAVKEIYEAVAAILDKNTAGKDLDVSSIPFEVCSYIIRDYFKYYQEQLKEVVFPQSQQTNN